MTNDLPNSPSTGGDPDEFDDEEGKMDAADAGLDTDEDTSRKVPKPGAKVTQGGNVNPDGSNKTTSDRDDKEDFRDDDRPINASKKTKKKVNAMKEQDKDTEDDDTDDAATDDAATQDRLNRERGKVDKEYQSWRKKKGLDASKKTEDKDWIQKAVNPKHKGYCTPMTKSTCTPARKALAKRFKKAGSKEKKEGGTGWQGKV